MHLCFLDLGRTCSMAVDHTKMWTVKEKCSASPRAVALKSAGLEVRGQMLWGKGHHPHNASCFQHEVPSEADL